jgi:uroporphyrinogen-III synthase
MSIAGRQIALAEGRQLEDLAALLEREGANSLRYPMLSILDPSDDAPALAWLRELIDGQFDWVVLFTGEGVRRLLACAERHELRDAVVAALGKARTVTRGPKPNRALAEIGLKSTRSAGIPTTDGVIASLKNEDLAGRSVGVQLYREDNPAFLEFLKSKGALAKTVLPYVYAPASDAERVLDLVQRLEDKAVDALVFTSAPQVERLFDVATEAKREKSLRAGLAATKVAAVGPVVAEALRGCRVRVDICPEQGWVMKNLVQQIKKAFDGATAEG